MAEHAPKQLLHLVFGGELAATDAIEFKDLNKLDIVGLFPNYASALSAWRARAQASEDSANIAVPARNTRRRPRRSAERPPSIRKPANVRV